MDANAVERGRERLHMGNFAGHQELQSADRAGIFGETDETFVNDLGQVLPVMLMRGSISSFLIILR